jgi:5-methylcytosine-specific restriction endonuclease McrA
LRERIKVRQRVLERDPSCRRCHQRRSEEVHELKRRSQGGDFLNEAECVGLCRECHEFVTTHPREAHAEGFVAWSWEDAEEAARRLRMRP